MTTNESETHQPTSLGCGVLGRHPIMAVVGFAAIGVAVGIGLSSWSPDDSDIKDVILTWVGLFGDLFIRTLKAAVLPLVFVNVVISVVDMMLIGRASSVGVKTIVLYTITTLIASTVGLIAILCFKGLFEQGHFDDDSTPLIQLGCTTEGSLLMESAVDGSLMCVDAANASSPFSQFEIIDVSAGLSLSEGSSYTELTISETIYDGVFMKLVTDNILYSFVDGNFASVVLFAIVFGVSLGRVMFENKVSKLSASSIVALFQEVADVLLKIINWIIACTPFAVLSLIANAVGSQNDLGGTFQNVGYLVAASLSGFIVHFIVTDIGFFYVASGGVNPFTYLQHVIPAQTTALACASSAATLPVTLRCVKNSGMVPDDIRNFVCPLGATINMDGSAIYFPCACIWLAVLNGIEPNAGSYFLLIILATVGSAGTAPVPSAALVLVITAYNTVFGTSGTPQGFEYVVAVDWFLDRCITALNVTGDTVVAAIVSARTPLEEDDAPKESHVTKHMAEDGSSEEEQTA
eukprot:Nitzschia sp. Nitz4//scaffold153_size53422//1754//3313//NITZ4_006756-RA/size53422-processed-gene-0.10-mRNA-1//1//CDS//3329537247//3024//frame0